MRRTASLELKLTMPLRELFPPGDAPAIETTRWRTLRVGVRLERAALVPSQLPAAVPEEDAIALGIDAGHTRPARALTEPPDPLRLGPR